VLIEVERKGRMEWFTNGSGVLVAERIEKKEERKVRQMVVGVG